MARSCWKIADPRSLSSHWHLQTFSQKRTKTSVLLVLIFNLGNFIHHDQFNFSICLHAAGSIFCSFCLRQAIAFWSKIHLSETNFFEDINEDNAFLLIYFLAINFSLQMIVCGHVDIIVHIRERFLQWFSVFRPAFSPSLLQSASFTK